MSVYIKGMNIPESCYGCALFGEIADAYGLKMYGCRVLRKDVPFEAGYKHPDCPIHRAKDQDFQSDKVCSFCGKKGCYAHGLCRNCYGRQRRNGSPEYKRRGRSVKKKDSQ